MSNLSSSPKNFQRFLELQRSSERSLSPENELRQMTIAARPPPQAGLPGGPVVAGRASPIGESNSNNPAAARSPLDEARTRAAVLWQYGSPLYYPPTGVFYCWALHPLLPRLPSSSPHLAEISCDFCGMIGPSEARDRETNRTGASARLSSSSSSSPPLFLHCPLCDTDLCRYCASDVRQNERFHLPCLQCTSCGEYVAVDMAVPHRCAPVKKDRTAGASIKQERREEDEKSAEHKGLGPRRAEGRPPARLPPPSPALAKTAPAPPSDGALPAPERPQASTRRRTRDAAPAGKPKRVHKTKAEQQARAERRAAREAKRATKANARWQRLTQRIARLQAKRKPIPPALQAKQVAAAAHPDMAFVWRIVGPEATHAPVTAPASTASAKAKSPAPAVAARAPVPAPAKTLRAPAGSARREAKPAETKRQPPRRRRRSDSDDDDDDESESESESDDSDEATDSFVASEPPDKSLSETPQRQRETEEATGEEPEEEEEVGTESAAAAGGALPVLSRPPLKSEWLVTVSLASQEDRDEVQRIATELRLTALAALRASASSVVFVLRTRLGAEKCARRASDAGMQTSLRKAL